MPRLKRLRAKEIIKIFRIFGFEIKSQKGSHVKLARVKTHEQVLIISLHRSLDVGAIAGIYDQALKYIAEEDLRPHFYI